MASPVDTSVKFALSNMAGAPLINGQAGTRLAAIKAFAVTGFGVKAVDAGGTISGGKCRLPFSSGASAAVVNGVILVTGATPAALNGEQKVTAVSTAWVEFATALPDGAVTGAGISFKMAPLGWEEVYTKTNVSVFRPTDPASSRPYFRIDDSNALYVIVQMYESMTDVDTGFNPSPARYWNARSAASANGVSWTLVGDARGMFVCIAPYSANPSEFFTTNIWYVGDQISDRSGDAYSGMCMGNTTNAVNSVDGVLFQGATTGFVMRIAAGLGGPVAASIINGVFSGGVSGNDALMGAFPSRAANALFLAPVYVADGGTFAVTGRRGRLPGALYCPQSGLLGVYGAAPTQVAGSGDYAGKTLLALSFGNNGAGQPNGMAFFDLNGPWRVV